MIDAPDPGAVTYWGTTSGAPLRNRWEVVRWSARQVPPDHARELATLAEDRATRDS